MSGQRHARPDTCAKTSQVSRSSVLSQQGHWDPATRQLVLDRVYHVPPIRFFSPQEAETLQAVVDILMPQDDRPPDERVPIVNYVDEEQYKGETPGYRYEDMPDERTGWRWGLEGIDQTSQALFGRRFVALAPAERRQALERLRQGDAPGEVWQRMPASRFFSGTLVGAVISSYYSHPYAWDEIGYGGPAYPRGYYALNHGAREHWEVEERR
ncbi:MAG TPA: gluconate 2-dehydrogenase subunit 3 family protein [Anaerolineae bacterium]|nr:gluconate 2-dehydrogenase subunit 3 family protein [Anaerolineae bacterium]HOQ98659.1 gluconate 2-dehydrogenase subunit 3 family protein [Anaerolineae bacterium]HPL30163.1 gluconate 2-dehydrogenase subunit 3 family protein [Anaerolineae bacterium]